MMVATSGDEWTGIFAQLNSGTYNSQWVVTDGKMAIDSGKVLKNGTVWVLEQIPTYVWRGDVSSIVSDQGYWPSYNIPYNEKVYNMSGYPARAASNPEMGYNTTGRAKIFARNAS